MKRHSKICTNTHTLQKVPCGWKASAGLALPSICEAALPAMASALYMRMRSLVAGKRNSKYLSCPKFCFRAALTASLIA